MELVGLFAWRPLSKSFLVREESSRLAALRKDGQGRLGPILLPIHHAFVEPVSGIYLTCSLPRILWGSRASPFADTYMRLTKNRGNLVAFPVELITLRFPHRCASWVTVSANFIPYHLLPLRSQAVVTILLPAAS